MVAPIGLVAGLVTGAEKTKYEVTTGEYNTALDTKSARSRQLVLREGGLREEWHRWRVILEGI
jgi:hypothetical protein